jgi:dihydroorotase
MRWHIRGGRVIDPARGLDRVTDLYLAAGRVLSVDAPPSGFGDGQVREIDARDLLVCPGFVDLCARLREPGSEHKATILSETRAAARAGITTLCCPPDTLPVIDTPAVAELVHRRAEESGHAKVVCLGALTAGLAGRQLAEMFHLKAIGCVGVSNAMSPIGDAEVLRRAFEYAATAGLTVFLHADDPWLGRGCLHEGPVATRLGLPGIPETAETVALSRDLLLIEQTGVRAHFCRLSSARAVALVRAAQDASLPITADVAAHQLHLTDIDVGYYDSLCHVRPPLRTLRDREGLRAGVRAGVIGAICSDHQPHERDAKTAPFEATEPGISALETLLPLTLALVGDALLTLPEAIAALSLRPARILGIEAGSLAPGTPADVCLFDPDVDRRLTEETLVSAGKNTPFLGWHLRGRVTHTFVSGRLVFEDAAALR